MQFLAPRTALNSWVKRWTPVSSSDQVRVYSKRRIQLRSSWPSQSEQLVSSLWSHSLYPLKHARVESKLDKYDWAWLSHDRVVMTVSTPSILHLDSSRLYQSGGKVPQLLKILSDITSGTEVHLRNSKISEHAPSKTKEREAKRRSDKAQEWVGTCLISALPWWPPATPSDDHVTAEYEVCAVCNLKNKSKNHDEPTMVESFWVILELDWIDWT
jgi:hypothetical protein